MEALLSAIGRHGYILVFVIVLAEAVGMPVPAALALVAGGAAAAAGLLRLTSLVLLSITAMLIGVSFRFVLGRYMGWGLLGFLCKLSVNPETCILRSAESFYKRGKATLVIAKFIPGLNTMAAPLAGSMKMRFGQFLQLDFVGALLYTVTYLLVGYVSRDFLAVILRGFHAAGRAMEIIVIAALVGYAIYRASQFQRHKKYRIMPRVQVQELAARLPRSQANRRLVAEC